MKSNFQISVIGESTVDESTTKYHLAQTLGKTLIDNGYRIIHGGMFGIMEAVSRGAQQSDHYSPGMVIGILPSFNPSQSNQYTDVVIPTGLDTFRNGIVANSDAVVAIGGGAGTLSEMAMAWILKRMIIAYDVSGWSGNLAGKRIDNRKRITWEHDRVFKVSDEKQVVNLLNEYLPFYSKRHSTINELK